MVYKAFGFATIPRLRFVCSLLNIVKKVYGSVFVRHKFNRHIDRLSTKPIKIAPLHHKPRFDFFIHSLVPSHLSLIASSSTNISQAFIVVHYRSAGHCYGAADYSSINSAASRYRSTCLRRIDYAIEGAAS